MKANKGTYERSLQSISNCPWREQAVNTSSCDLATHHWVKSGFQTRNSSFQTRYSTFQTYSSFQTRYSRLNDNWPSIWKSGTLRDNQRTRLSQIWINIVEKINWQKGVNWWCDRPATLARLLGIFQSVSISGVTVRRLLRDYLAT